MIIQTTPRATSEPHAPRGVLKDVRQPYFTPLAVRLKVALAWLAVLAGGLS